MNDDAKVVLWAIVLMIVAAWGLVLIGSATEVAKVYVATH